jgi:hypothetical protein
MSSAATAQRTATGMARRCRLRSGASCPRFRSVEQRLSAGTCCAVVAKACGHALTRSWIFRCLTGSGRTALADKRQLCEAGGQRAFAGLTNSLIGHGIESTDGSRS